MLLYIYLRGKWGVGLAEVSYKTSRMRKICEDARVARRIYGDQMAEKIQLRIEQLRAATSISMLIKFHIGRCHQLFGDREGQLAMDLVHPYRLIFVEKTEGEWVAVEITEIVDYH